MLEVSVIAYYADDPTRTYQLTQWLPVLESLHQRHPVAVVVRDPTSASVLAEGTMLPVLTAPSFPELTALYERLGAKVALYCNNSMRNFESLIDGRLLHVHVNHGESDKQSMASNNAKAYDRVFVAGEAAVQRHASSLMEFDTGRLVRVGRPQFDVRLPPLLQSSARRTVLYAPTWEGDADYNDYTSVDTIGLDIVRAIAAVPDVRLVYKPHPKLATTTTPAVAAAHGALLAAVADLALREPGAGHVAVVGGDIRAVIPSCDAIVTDVSAVGLDWLYLRPEKPILITDRHHDAERMRREVPVSRCADVIDTVDVPALAARIAERLDHDEHRLARAAMRQHYFDDLQVGESVVRFIEAVHDLVLLRDRLIAADAESADTA